MRDVRDWQEIESKLYRPAQWMGSIGGMEHMPIDPAKTKRRQANTALIRVRWWREEQAIHAAA
ncbi:MAG TPA: hypothetical protein VF306_17380 [Pirellulales bacterium]